MKRIFSLALAGVMMFSALPVAYAADTADYTAGTQVSYTADADANREYSITVPALLNPGQSGTVTLKGKWASNETVKVTADATVELTNSINSNDKKVLNITFAGMEKAGDNVEEKTYTENVAVATMPADALFGAWSGRFNYNVEFDDGKQVEMISFKLGSTEYQAEKGMTYGEWVVSEYNTSGMTIQAPNEHIDVQYIGNTYGALCHTNESVPTEAIAVKLDEVIAAGSQHKQVMPQYVNG